MVQNCKTNIEILKDEVKNIKECFKMHKKEIDDKNANSYETVKDGVRNMYNDFIYRIDELEKGSKSSESDLKKVNNELAKQINKEKEIEMKLKSYTEEHTQKTITLDKDIKNMQRKLASELEEVKKKVDSKEKYGKVHDDHKIMDIKIDLEEKIKHSKDEFDTFIYYNKELENKVINLRDEIEKKVETSKDEFATKFTLMDTKTQKSKEDLTKRVTDLKFDIEKRFLEVNNNISTSLMSWEVENKISSNKLEDNITGNSQIIKEINFLTTSQLKHENSLQANQSMTQTLKEDLQKLNQDFETYKNNVDDMKNLENTVHDENLNNLEVKIDKNMKNLDRGLADALRKLELKMEENTQFCNKLPSISDIDSKISIHQGELERALKRIHSELSEVDMTCKRNIQNNTESINSKLETYIDNTNKKQQDSIEAMEKCKVQLNNDLGTFGVQIEKIKLDIDKQMELHNDVINNAKNQDKHLSAVENNLECKLGDVENRLNQKIIMCEKGLSDNADVAASSKEEIKQMIDTSLKEILAVIDDNKTKIDENVIRTLEADFQKMKQDFDRYKTNADEKKKIEYTVQDDKLINLEVKIDKEIKNLDTGLADALRKLEQKIEENTQFCNKLPSISDENSKMSTKLMEVERALKKVQIELSEVDTSCQRNIHKHTESINSKLETYIDNMNKKQQDSIGVMETYKTQQNNDLGTFGVRIKKIELDIEKQMELYSDVIDNTKNEDKHLSSVDNKLECLLREVENRLEQKIVMHEKEISDNTNVTKQIIDTSIKDIKALVDDTKNKVNESEHQILSTKSCINDISRKYEEIEQKLQSTNQELLLNKTTMENSLDIFNREISLKVTKHSNLLELLNKEMNDIETELNKIQMDITSMKKIKEKNVYSSVEENAQIQSLVTEVQNIIGQVRDLGTQNKEVQDKVRRIELNDGTERLGLEFAKTISRLEKVEREAGGGAQKAQEIGTFADDVAKRIDVLENDLRRSKMGADDIKRVVDKIEKESAFSAESSSKRIDTCEKQLEKFEKETRITSNESIQKMRGIEQEVRTLEESLKRKLEENKLASVTSNDSIKKMGSIEQELRTLEESLKRKIDESKTASSAATDTTNKKLISLEKDINNVSAEGNRCKSMVDQLTTKFNKLEKEEETARDSRRQQNTLSMEDVKKDFNKLQDQLTYLEEKVLALQKQVDGSTIEGKNTKENITGEIGLLADKVKNLSVVIKDDKFKNEEKLVKLEKQVQDINQDTTKIEKNITTLTGTQSKLEKSLSSVDDASRSCKSDVETLKSDLNNVRVISNKNIKEIEEHSGKLFDCIHDFENLKEDLEKLNKKIDKRPAVEEMDKKSELSNQLFNTLSTRIDDVESSVAKESKKTKTELDKINKDIKNVSSKQEENNSQLSKDVTTLKNEMTALKGTAEDVKSIIKDITTLKTDKEKSSKDIKNANDKSDETKVQLSSLQSEVKSLLSVIDKVKSIEKEIGVSKKENSSDKLTSIEKECSSLRADHEKMNKDMKSISTDLKYVDSLLKKEVANTKTELSSFGKTLKSNDKDILSLQGMVEVLNNSLKDESSSDANLEKITNLQNEIRKFSDNIKGCERKIDENKDVIQKKVMNDVKDIEEKIKKVKDELTLKLSTCNSEISNLGGKIDTNSKETKQLADTKEIDKKIKTAKEDLEEKIKKSKEEVVSKVTSCTSDIKGLEKKMDTMIKEGKSQSDTKDLDSKIKVVKDDLISKLTSLDTKITTVKEDIGPKVLNISTETKALDKKLTEIDKKSTQLQKDNESKKTTEILNKSSDDTKDIKKDIDKINQQIKENMTKYDSKVAEVKSSVKEVNDKLEKSTDDTKNIKKDIDKINQQIKENMLKCDGKVTEVKSSVKEVNDKLVKLEKSQTEAKSKTAPKDNSAEVKKDMDKINQLIKDNLKSCQDKGVQQEAQLREVKTSIKDVNDQLVVQVAKLSAKIEKDGRATPKPGAGAESAKLMTLTKAIDSIQDNTKSLETMVTKMKSEFTTSKDLEKLRTELKGGGLGDLGNHPDMGPIMDSLIMTNDRPFVDCATVTPMTGNGLVKFERFNAMNKLPWDDVGDQFVIQEPGVYCVNVTAILQDAGLSIKLASPVLEREVASLGSRDGLLGSSCPAFISRSALFQIDDDENCVETVLVEIHADNEDSFIDKNVTLTMFKIAEGSGQNDE